MNAGRRTRIGSGRDGDAGAVATAPSRGHIARLLVVMVLGVLTATVAGGGAAQAASGAVGYHRDNGGYCRDDGGTATRVEAPFVKSATGGWQYVTYKAVLWRWSGTSCVRWINGPLVGGWASGTVNRLPSATRFAPVGSGFYKASIEHRWYTGSTVTGFDHWWVSSLYTPPAVGSYGGLAGGGSWGELCIY